jgi:hypothetical protein
MNYSVAPTLRSARAGLKPGATWKQKDDSREDYYGVGLSYHLVRRVGFSGCPDRSRHEFAIFQHP